MKLERTKNARRGITWGLIERIITVLFTFIIRTVMIKTIGKDYLGLSSLFTSVLQILNLSELGFSSAIVYSLYKPIADEDYETIGGILNFYKKVYRVIGCIILLVGIALIPFIPHLINGDVPADINLIALYLIYLSSAVFSYLLFAYKNAILVAYQKNDVVSSINVFVHLALYIFQIAGLFIFKNYYWYVILLPLSNIAINIITSIVADRMFPNIVSKGKIEKSVINDIIEKVKGLFVAKLCTATRNTLDSIFISAFLGLGVLAIYDNYYRIVYSIFTVLTIIQNSIRSGIGNSLVTETKEKNYNDFHKFVFLYSCIAGWCLSCLMCLFQPFMYLWMGKEMMLSNSYLLIFGVYFYALSLGDIRTVYFDAAGLWWYGVKYSLAESLVNVVLNWILVKCIGLSGVMLSTIISIIVVNFFISSGLLYKHFFTEYAVKDFFLWHMKYAIINVGICIFTVLICHNILYGYSFITLILRVIICCIVPSILYLLIYKRQKEWNYIQPILKKLKR